MRTIHRDIVGAFIFSSEGKVLLGYNKKGGVYQGLLTPPAGGIEENETELDALKREVTEETGIDISGEEINKIEGFSTGESEKVLKDTGELIHVEMKFYDYEVKLSHPSSDVALHFDSDYGKANWYSPKDLNDKPITQTAKITLQKFHFL